MKKNNKTRNVSSVRKYIKRKKAKDIKTVKSKGKTFLKSELAHPPIKAGSIPVCSL